MRTLLVASLVFVVSWFGLAAIEAKESADARVRARVREFTDPAVAGARREACVRDLADEAPPLVGKVVREALLSDARRAAAADLAARLRLPGVFAFARRWADGPAGDRIVALALASPEPEAGAWVVARWSGEDPACARHGVVHEALRTTPASPAVVEGVAGSLADPVRSAAALEVLRAQMAVDDATAEALSARWEEAWARYLFEAREFPRDGDDLLAGAPPAASGVRRVGRNLRLAPRAWADVAALPPRARLDPGVLRLRVAAGSGTGAFVSLRSADGAQDLRLRCDGRVWFLVEGPPREGARAEAPFRARTWSEVEVRVTDPGLRDRPDARDVRVLVDGAEVRPSGGWWRLGAPPAHVAVGAAEGDEPTLVGGVSWR